MLAPGANALKTVDAIKAKANELKASLPPGMKLFYPVDNTLFIRLSIHDVVVTLVEAIAKHAWTRTIGDGKIWVTPVDSALRVRTGERDRAAI